MKAIFLGNTYYINFNTEKYFACIISLFWLTSTYLFRCFWRLSYLNRPEEPTENLSSMKIRYLSPSLRSFLRCFPVQFAIFVQTRQIFREGVFSFAARNSRPCWYKLFDSIRFESTRFEG